MIFVVNSIWNNLVFWPEIIIIKNNIMRYYFCFSVCWRLWCMNNAFHYQLHMWRFIMKHKYIAGCCRVHVKYTDNIRFGDFHAIFQVGCRKVQMECSVALYIYYSFGLNRSWASCFIIWEAQIENTKVHVTYMSWRKSHREALTHTDAEITV